MKISIFTTYTNPEERKDPWREALNCYEDFADEIIVTGKDWPYEFSWDLIGKTFEKGYQKSTGDWVIRMDIDYFFHEKNLKRLSKLLSDYNDYPGVVFPQYQFFTPDRFQLKTRLCVALNKKRFPEIKLNGGGDLCLATLNGKLLDVNKLPNLNIPIFQYDSMFRTKKIIAKDRARFARAWERHFKNYGKRGGSTDLEAFNAWFREIESKYKMHTNRIKFSQHPKYIKDTLSSINYDQFGFNAFGLKDNTKRSIKSYTKGKKELYIDSLLINRSLK
ncbi:hypothetical protein OA408_00470 [Acidimicrobiaceae bacterium]|nr:hypothetical protein [Acidimicrobiaceae bacterium]